MRNYFAFFAITLLLPLYAGAENSIIAADILPRSKNIGAAKNNKLDEFCKTWLGAPYRMGGCQKTGIDCSCFARTLYSSVYNVNLARSSAEQFAQCKPIRKNRLREGDLVFFRIKGRKVNHVGVYLGKGDFIHASTSRGVIINNLSEAYYSKYFYKGGRLRRPQR
jgi:murein DD-endopeptidase / murein LD-carboxypeptidase